jgi:hypothetical protein
MLKDASDGATIATGTAGVVGSIVGAYLGVKIGTDVAGAGRREEAARATPIASTFPSRVETKLMTMPIGRRSGSQRRLNAGWLGH